MKSRNRCAVPREHANAFMPSPSRAGSHHSFAMQPRLFKSLTRTTPTQNSAHSRVDQ